MSPDGWVAAVVIVPSAAALVGWMITPGVRSMIRAVRRRRLQQEWEGWLAGFAERQRTRLRCGANLEAEVPPGVTWRQPRGQQAYPHSLIRESGVIEYTSRIT